MCVHMRPNECEHSSTCCMRACVSVRMLGQAVRTSGKHMEREHYYVTHPAISSDSLILNKARPQGVLLSLWFPEGP